VRDLSQLGESVRIEVSKEGVRFASDGEAANGNVLLRQYDGSHITGSTIKPKSGDGNEEEDEAEGSSRTKAKVKKEKTDGDVEMEIKKRRMKIKRRTTKMRKTSSQRRMKMAKRRRMTTTRRKIAAARSERRRCVPKIPYVFFLLSLIHFRPIGQRRLEAQQETQNFQEGQGD
jgi:hypothetical protein